MRLRLWTAEDRLCEGNKNTLGHQQAAESSWISHRISTPWCLVPLLWRLQQTPEISPSGKGTLLCAETWLHCTTGARLATPHSPQWTWGSAANLPRAWRGHWRGSISQHSAHEAQQGSWGEGSGTPAMLKQVQWEKEAVSISLPPCPAVSLMPPSCLTLLLKAGIQEVLFKTCWGFYCISLWLIFQILIVPALDEEFPVWSGLFFLGAKPLFFQVLFRVGPFLLESKSLLTNSFQLKKHGQEQRSQINLSVFLFFHKLDLPLTVQKMSRSFRMAFTYVIFNRTFLLYRIMLLLKHPLSSSQLFKK